MNPINTFFTKTTKIMELFYNDNFIDVFKNNKNNEIIELIGLYDNFETQLFYINYFIKENKNEFIFELSSVLDFLKYDDIDYKVVNILSDNFKEKKDFIILNERNLLKEEKYHYFQYFNFNKINNNTLILFNKNVFKFLSIKLDGYRVDESINYYLKIEDLYLKFVNTFTFKDEKKNKKILDFEINNNESDNESDNESNNKDDFNDDDNKNNDNECNNDNEFSNNDSESNNDNEELIQNEKFNKNLDDLVKNFKTQKINLIKNLEKNYKKNINYIKKKDKINKCGSGGYNKITYLLKEETYDLLKNSYNLRNRYITDIANNIKQVKLCMCIENQTIGFIQNTYNNIVNCKRQYIIGRYRIDLYFPDYKLIIECDENNHDDRDPEYEKKREEYLIKLENTIIRFNPNIDNFDISNVLNTINRLLFKIDVNHTKVIYL